MESSAYNGEIVAGSLLIPESRVIANLLIEGADDHLFHQKVIIENILQKRSPASAKRQAKLIRNRLGSFDGELLQLIQNGSHEQAVQLLLASAIMHSHLLGDFIKQAITTQIKTYQKEISYRDWDYFFEECKHRDPSLEKWAESTTKKVRQVIFRILAEAGIIDSTRTMNLLPFSLLPEVKELLEKHGHVYPLDCLEIFR
ncbi:DUF1819 family protein [Oleidesulfovibrio alaskensis]|uniref:DUF1819 family protein n=1 Tax=Oleidesulfovibrio alaskensis TaxID=58180 RepID=UPI001DDDE2EF|nr:DUF1819 family protein [Oleidesulfovibrio alaskensis]MBG0773464.1 DUF1819 family protein [Oleidesulfovibrio alaskensis]